MLNKNKLIVLTLIVIIFIILIGFFFYSKNNKSYSNPTKNATNNIKTSITTPTPLEALTYNCSKGQSVFSLLKKIDPNVTYSKSSYGVFVTAINGVKQNGGKYWIFSVNGKEATTSADTYICQGNDQVSWQLKK